MKRDKRFGYIASISLVLSASVIAAALTSSCLNLSELGFLYTLGNVLIISYGFSAVLIPLILLGVAFILHFRALSKWRARAAFVAVPFFTVVFIEKVCRLIYEKSFSLRIVEIALTVFAGALVVLIELIVLGRVNLPYSVNQKDDDKAEENKSEKDVHAAENERKEKRDPFTGVFDSLGVGRATTLTQDEIAALTAFEKSEKEEIPADKLEWKLPMENGAEERGVSKDDKKDSKNEKSTDSSVADSGASDAKSPVSDEAVDGKEEVSAVMKEAEQEESEAEKEVELGKFSEVFSDMDVDVEDSLLAESFEKGGEFTRHMSVESGDGNVGRVLLRSGTGLLRGKDLRAALLEAEDEVKKNSEQQNNASRELSSSEGDTLTFDSKEVFFATKDDEEDISSEEASEFSFYDKYKVSPSSSYLKNSVFHTDKENESSENILGEKEEFESEGEEDFLLNSDSHNTEPSFLDEDETDEEDSAKYEETVSNPMQNAERVVEEKKYVPVKAPYSIPSDLLNEFEDDPYWLVDEKTESAGECLTETLREFNISATISDIKKGPVVTMYEILPAPGVKLSKIVSLQDNIALRMAASSVRIVAPIPGKAVVGIEVPNEKRSIVSFRELIEMTDCEAEDFEIPIILGKDILGKPEVLDLVKTPHLLIAGATGSGKSVCVNSMILSILYKRSPEKVRMILIDPKIVELKLYNDIPHLLTPVITEPKRAFQALQYCLCEMERRYSLLDGLGVRDIKSYNKKIKSRHLLNEKLPYIVVIIDEFADLMATTGKELESTVSRLAAMSRAVGIHLVLATQRPSIDVITGLIKANIPTRIAFMVASKTDSRIIIDQSGAEMLLGKGDMLYCSAASPFAKRIQGTFVDDEEVERVVDYVKTLGKADYIDEEIFIDDEEDEPISLDEDGSDPLYDEALDIVIKSGKASASYIQRRLKVGYNRAARIVEEMYERGIVGPPNGSKPRELLYVP